MLIWTVIWEENKVSCTHVQTLLYRVWQFFLAARQWRRQPVDRGTEEKGGLWASTPSCTIHSVWTHLRRWDCCGWPQEGLQPCGWGARFGRPSEPRSCCPQPCVPRGVVRFYHLWGFASCEDFSRTYCGKVYLYINHLTVLTPLLRYHMYLL